MRFYKSFELVDSCAPAFYFCIHHELEVHLIRGKKYLKAGVETRDVAQFVVMAHEGFYGMLKGVGNKGTFKILHSSMKIYFDAISA